MRRHPLLAALALLLLLTVAAAALFIATFDLNRHRDRLQSLLTTAAKRPVSFGNAHLSWRHGISLAIADLRLAPVADATWELRAEQVFLRLELAPLLRRELRFSAIVLEGAQLQVVLTGEPKDASLPDLRGWQLTGVRSIALHRGQLVVEDLREPERPWRLEVDQASARLSNLAVGQAAWISVSGRLRQAAQAAMVTLGGELQIADEPGASQVNLALRLEQFDPAPWLARYGAEPPLTSEGALSLNLKLIGNVNAGFGLDAEVTGHDLTVQFSADAPPQPVTRARLQGTLHTNRQGGSLAGFDLSLDGLACRGQLAWQQQEEGIYLQANLATPPLPLPELLRRLPARWGEPLRQRTTGGRLEIISLHFAGPLASLQTPEEGLPLQAEVAVDAVRLGPLAGEELTEVAFQATLAADLLQVSAGEARWHGVRYRFAGTLEHPFAPQPELTAEISGEPQSRQLVAALPPPWRQEIMTRGTLPCLLQVAGTRERLEFDLRADLTPVAVVWQDLAKPAGVEGSLALAGAITPSQLNLSRARLRLPPLELRGEGELARNQKGAFALKLEAADVNLEAARDYWPLLEKLRTRGNLDLQLQISGHRGQIERRRGEFRLRQAGVHLTDVIADLQQVEAVLDLSDDQLQIRRLTARLGDSPISVEGGLKNFAQPRLQLRVRGKSIRADELIFPSATSHLRDVDGHLRLSGEEIVFDPVVVRLDGGTRAEVRGSVRWEPQPLVELTIVSPRGNIDEVIALWQTPESPSPATDETREPSKLVVRISAQVAEGELAGMQFQQAAGLITWQQRRLLIHPLDFHLGHGKAQGVVAVDFTATPSLLQVSGRVENVDAAILHHQLLKRRGLVNGRLQGDFYLEGGLGSRFLESSRGGASLEIRDGVLRRFKSLAKVFSVLNVSQIFTLHLPDMAREGMPFHLLHATFSLDSGVLASEDLLIDSNAMNLSLVGQADLTTDQIDFIMGVKPLGTVDQIVTRIPVAGWILTGEEKALITAHFTIRGDFDDPQVVPVPITSVSEKVRGIFRRVLNLPGKMIGEMEGMIQGD
ncbi:MAG: AsmA-like C-terminal domain-containing protein [Desulfuromonadales bacterium]|nr:AsmA-like C-terminal domain-containing protein [Desulfuromonadales bacterium]